MLVHYFEGTSALKNSVGSSITYKILELVANELQSIVCEYILRYDELANNVFPDEHPKILVFDASIGFGCDPLGAIIYQG